MRACAGEILTLLIIDNVLQGGAAHTAGVVFPTDEDLLKRTLLVANMPKSIKPDQVCAVHDLNACPTISHWYLGPWPVRHLRIKHQPSHGSSHSNSDDVRVPVCS